MGCGKCCYSFRSHSPAGGDRAEGEEVNHTTRVLFSLAVTALVVAGTIYAIRYLASLSAEQTDRPLIQKR